MIAFCWNGIIFCFSLSTIKSWHRDTNTLPKYWIRLTERPILRELWFLCCVMRLKLIMMTSSDGNVTNVNFSIVLVPGHQIPKTATQVKFGCQWTRYSDTRSPRGGSDMKELIGYWNRSSNHSHCCICISLSNTLVVLISINNLFRLSTKQKHYISSTHMWQVDSPHKGAAMQELLLLARLFH